MRPTDVFAAGHRPGAVGIPVSGSQLRDEGGVRPAGASSSSSTRPTRTRPCARRGRCTRSALFGIAGWQAGGGSEQLEPVSLDELEQLLADDAVELLDVREADERDEGHIPGSRHLPYRTARAAAEAGLLNGRPLVTICESGPRAAVAASVLQAAGLDARPVLDGGVADWRAHGGEVSLVPPLRRR